MEHMDRTFIARVAMQEQAAASAALSAAIQRVASRLRRGEKPSNLELAREESALLRLQNARALRELGLPPGGDQAD
jgi:hypothetical protein